MILAKCNFLRLVLIITFHCSVLCFGFHPMAMAMAPRTTQESHSSETSEQGSSEEQNYLLNDQDSDNNIIRLDSSNHPLASALSPMEENKRISNYVRYGRMPKRSYFRYSRRSPLETALDYSDESPELVKRGYDHNNFLRHVKAYSRNYVRFGRSTPEHEEEEDEEEEIKNKNRKKRSIIFEDDIPMNEYWWLNNDNLQQQHLMNMEKRGKSKDDSYIRWGRNPYNLHYTRFGKGEVSPLTDNFQRMRKDQSYVRFGG